MSGKMNQKELVTLTSYLFHEYYMGNPTPWFDYLSSGSVYLCNGDPILVGKSAITAYFQVRRAQTGRQVNIIREEYDPLILGERSALVYGQFVLGSREDRYWATSKFTMTYCETAEGIRIVHQQNSYEFMKAEAGIKSETLDMSAEAMRFVERLLMDQPLNERLPLKSGNRLMFVNPYMVLYVQGCGRKTEFVCVDRVISCNSPLNEIAEKAPAYFYPIHRSYLVNTRYVTGIERFEVELISGIRLPIPEHNYTRVKNDLRRMI